LANIIAGRMPSTVSMKPPPAFPRMVDEGSFAKYFGKFELGRADNNSQFIPTTTLASDDFMRVSVETKDPQQRYSLWITDAKQNVYSVQYGILGTAIFEPDTPLNSGEYTAHLEIAGVIYARKVFTLKESGSVTSSAPPATISSTQPQIISLEFPKEIPFDTNRYDGQIRFRDDSGDLQRVAFDAPAGSAYQSFGFEFTNPAMRWVEGNASSTSGVFKFSYSCGQPSAVTNLTFAVTLYDKAGNKSAPYPLNFACKSGASNAASVMLINHHSQLCLTIFNGNIVQDECRGASNQMWQVPSDSGSFQIRSDSGGSLCVGGDGLTMVSCNASPVWNLQPLITSYSQYQPKSHPHPYTSPKPGATGTYFVISSLGKCVDNDSWSHTVGSRMIYFDCQPLNDNSNQLWARYR
jgi:hypothetical protein